MNEFTLHGLWPDKCGGSMVAYCDRDRERDDVEDRLKQTDIYNDMKKYWPSYKPTPQRPDYDDFWTHEWNKHGTCVTTLDPRCGYGGDKDLYAYFNMTLALRKRYNIYDALKKARITPRPRFDMDPREEDKYSVDAIHAAIEDEWHVKGTVYCKSGRPLELHFTDPMSHSPGLPCPFHMLGIHGFRVGHKLVITSIAQANILQ
ncbi:ribonuclease T2-like [Podila clonocystis]|nr:ribonuclease T2-like [Podila clonocystis]